MEVWLGVIGSGNSGDSTRHEYHVFAKSDAEAERKSLALEKKLDKFSRMTSPVCYATNFVLNVEG